MSEFVEESSATLNGVNEVPGSSASEIKGIMGFVIRPIFLFLWISADDNPFYHDIYLI